MPQNEAAAIDPLAGGTFSRLLFSDVEVDDAINIVGFHHHHHHHQPPDNTTAGTGASRFTFSSDQKPPKMLCFGADYVNSNTINVVSLTSQKSATTTTADDNNNPSSPSSTTNSTTTSLSSNSNMKRNMGCDYYQAVVLPTTLTTTDATTAPVKTSRRNYKKSKAENTPPASHAKVKEKLGERIAALQQMVSPYGKTDTASVLHEAMGYIKFLQEQVHVLCSPYLKRLPTTRIEGEENGGMERKKDLRSRGLCLVPTECTLHVAESNGADLWSPAMVNRHALHH